MKKHYETHVEDTDKLISVAGPVLDYKSWYERYRKLMEEQAQRKYGLYTPTSEGGDGFPRLPGDVTRWSFKGLTNEQMSKNPRLEDADHKGRFLTFKNFAWGEMSGVGGYTQNYNNSAWRLALDRAETTKTGHSFNVTSVTSTVVAFYYQSGRGQEPFTVKSQIVRVSGLTDGQSIKYGTGAKSVLVIESDGIYTLPPFDFAAKGIWYGFSFGKIQESCNITIEQLPYYPGFIIGDGVDDYAETEQELNFEDTYTVYTAFIPFQNNPTRNMILCGANSKKTFSIQYSSLVYVSFIAGNNYYINANFVNGLNLFACKRNGNNICIKNLLTNKVVTGTCGDWVENAGLYYLWKNATYASFAKAAIAGQTICNGYFSTDEDDEKVLDWYKKQYSWLFPDQAWTVVGKTNEDKDRATIANITGNGNNLVLSNFGFAGNSGYGEYAQNFNIDKWTIATPSRVEATKTNSSFNITEVKSTAIQLYYLSTQKEVAFTILSTKVRVTGLTDGQTINYRYFVDDVANDFLIPSDGIYNLPEFEFPAKGDYYGFNLTKVQSSCNITIEQIPNHEGYLVTDGVDDRIGSSSFTFNKDWTIVGNWTMLSNIPSSCGIVKASSIFLYNSLDGVTIYFSGGPIKIQSKSINAFCSNGRIYLNDWTEILKPDVQTVLGRISNLNIASYSDKFTKMAFKNLAIYDGKILSKDDCIKAYNYLQTLKAK